VAWLEAAVYRALLRFRIQLFALGFAMAVVTGVVLAYEIGTNWSVFAERTANVIGPFFTYEVLRRYCRRNRCRAVRAVSSGRPVAVQWTYRSG
jgi:hypothetical protein